MFLRFADSNEIKQIKEDIYHNYPIDFVLNVAEKSGLLAFDGYLDDFNILLGKSSYLEENIYEKLGSGNKKYIIGALAWYSTIFVLIYIIFIIIVWKIWSID